VKALILPAVLLINAVSYAARADEPVGRFQLVPATVDTGSRTAEKMLFKIDTVTGRAWLYIELGTPETTIVSKWIEIQQ
jgi:hypothetical protein